MNTYSLDLRHKILRAWHQRRGSQRAMATFFGVSQSFVEQLLRRHRATGEIAARPHGGGRRPICNEAARAYVRGLVHEQPDATLAELCTQLHARQGLRVSVPTMARIVTHLGLPRKKMSLHADERETARVQQARAAYQEEVVPLDCQRFKFVDESGVNLAMTRLYGRAPRGERVVGTLPQHDGANVTMLAALGSQGVEAVMTIDGATDAEVVRVDVEPVLCPTLRPGDIVIMDNLRAHKAAGIREAMAHAGAQWLYLPPYSPDLSPIERCWSKLKTYLRKAKARTRAALDHAIAQALATITISDARSWFQHCGYALH